MDELPQNMNQAETTQFLDGQTFARSELFEKLFREGMGMVEETAAYLDGPGRVESRDLPRLASLAYAGESMRLTTRLMQIASWLLVQRAIREGEMSLREAAAEKYRLGAQELCRGKQLDGADALPETLKDLIERSDRLYERVDRLDRALYGEEPKEVPSAVAQQIDMLQVAFGSASQD